MSMPYIDDDLEADDEINTSLEGYENEGTDLLFDVEGGDIECSDGDPDLVDGREALIQWMEKAFATRAHVYEIYEAESTAVVDGDEYDDEMPDTYGSEIREIMLDPEMDRELKLARVQADIENVLEKHPDIEAVSNFEFEQNKRTLTVRFLVTSVYGEDEREVNVDVQIG